MTHRYIGTKEVTAWPQEKDGQPGYAVKYADGYISWSPKEAFEQAYRVSEGADQALSFGDAIHYLKLGRKVARKGWNGKGMWLIMVPGTPAVELRPGSPYAKALPDLGSTEILPHIDMWTINAQGRRAMLPGWLASQSDMLATDWEVLS